MRLLANAIPAFLDSFNESDVVSGNTFASRALVSGLHRGMPSSLFESTLNESSKLLNANHCSIKFATRYRSKHGKTFIRLHAVGILCNGDIEHMKASDIRRANSDVKPGQTRGEQGSVTYMSCMHHK